jgi:VCBS repeat protein
MQKIESGAQDADGRTDASRKPDGSIVILRLSIAVMLAAGMRQSPVRFVAHEIATGLRGGYQVIAVDMNHDEKLDLLAVASNLPDLTWYENPTWTHHVLASGFTGLINVAAADLDGDGFPEIAVAHGFSTRPDQSAGIVSLLTHGADVTAPWSMREIDRVPSAHRLRWFTTRNAEKWLINSPLAGATSQPPDYKGATSIYYYRPPEWKRELLTDQEQGVVHAIEPVRWDSALGQVLCQRDS